MVMNNIFEMVEIAEKTGLFAELAEIFSDMDMEYEKSAASVGFSCRGCSESCCETRFYHFTWTEYLYLMKGLMNGLDGVEYDAFALMGDRARFVADYYRKGSQIDVPRIMCPVNEDGLCRLYDFRPMICRLHGVVHEFSMGGQKKEGPGCALFDAAANGKNIQPLDRTPFYSRMSMLEKKAREVLGQPGKIKMTVADMVESAFAEKRVI